MASETKKPFLDEWLIFGMIFGGAAIAFNLINLIFFPKKSCGCGSEAKSYTGSMNRAQQAYFLERITFTNSINSEAGIPLETDRYKYYSRSEKKIITPDYEILMVSNFSVAKKDNLQRTSLGN